MKLEYIQQRLDNSYNEYMNLLDKLSLAEDHVFHVYLANSTDSQSGQHAKEAREAEHTVNEIKQIIETLFIQRQQLFMAKAYLIKHKLSEIP